MTGDEAYYWQWSKHLSLGYHDHPPLIAWLLYIWQYLGGENVFWLRLLPLFLSTGTTIFVFLIAKNVTGNITAASYAAILTIVTPLLSFGGAAIIPDIPLLFFWSLALYTFTQVVFNNKAPSTLWWLITGAASGGAILSKLTGLLLPVSIFVFLLLSPRYRFWLLRTELYLGLTAAFFTVLPLLWWNGNNNWENFVYQYTHRAPPALTFKRFPDYILLQVVLVFSPAVFLLAVSSWYESFKRCIKNRSDKYVFFLVSSLLIHLVALCMAFIQQPGMHWALPGTLSSFVLIGMAISTSNNRNKLFMPSIALSSLLSFFCFLILLKPSIVGSAINSNYIASNLINKGKQLKSKEIAEFIGYEPLGNKIKEIKQKTDNGNASMIITTSYTLSSLLAYYSKEPSYVVLGSSVGSEYNRWINFKEYLGTSAIYVDFEPFDSRTDVAPVIRDAYEKVLLLPPITIQKDGIVIRTYYAAYCYNLKKDLFNSSSLYAKK